MFDRVQIKERAKAIYRSNVVKALVIGVVLWLVTEGNSGSTTEFNLSDSNDMVGAAQDSFYQLRSSHFWSLIPFAFAGYAIIRLLISVLISPVQTMLMYYYKDMSLGKESPNIMEVVQRGVFFKVAAVTILSAIGIGIATIFLVVPGIYLSYVWRYVGLIAVDHPEMSITEVFAESKRITMGYKFDLFVLDLSFIGWYIAVAVVSVISFGILGVIGGIALTPYTALSDVEAYNVLSLNFTESSEW